MKLEPQRSYARAENAGRVGRDTESVEMIYHLKLPGQSEAIPARITASSRAPRIKRLPRGARRTERLHLPSREDRERKNQIGIQDRRKVRGALIIGVISYQNLRSGGRTLARNPEISPTQTSGGDLDVRG